MASAPLRTDAKCGSGSTPRKIVVSAPASWKYSSTLASVPFFSTDEPPMTIIARLQGTDLMYSRQPCPNMSSEPASFIGRIMVASLPGGRAAALVLGAAPRGGRG